MNELPLRLRSIDVFRAITMLLMIFVNDLDPVKNVPEWIKHAGRDEDALGFADTIFPAFLFIVGLSIPLAIKNRMKKPASFYNLVFYIVSRSIALLIMGFIHVNLEHYSRVALLSKPIWEILATLSFFLVWLDYPKKFPLALRYVLQGLGLILLIILCILFKGENDGQVVGLRPYWWGILGLIGWSYLVCAGLFLLSKGRLPVLIFAAIFFFLFDLATQVGWIHDLYGTRNYIWIVGNGAMPAFTMAGVIVSGLYTELAAKNKLGLFWLALLFFGIGMGLIGFLVRPYGGISKIRATPAWVGICTGINILVFVLLIWLVDVKKKQNWFAIIMPAGMSTLTCYLIPYFLYSVYELVHFHYPPSLNEGIGGLLRSMLVAFLVVIFTGWLQKMRLCIRI